MGFGFPVNFAVLRGLLVIVCLLLVVSGFGFCGVVGDLIYLLGIVLRCVLIAIVVSFVCLLCLLGFYFLVVGAC